MYLTATIFCHQKQICTLHRHLHLYLYIYITHNTRIHCSLLQFIENPISKSPVFLYMGSLEEERLVQMVHDFIESGSSPLPIFPNSSNCLSLDHQATYFTLQEILEKMTEAENKVLQSVLRHMRSQKEAEKATGLKKWLVTRLQMDGFNASICQTSWLTSLGCPAGDYNYIDIILKDEKGNKKRLIVDIDFRSQFELARPTKSYEELTDIVPSFFIGSEEKLNKIISLLCSAAKQSLEERGLHVPPWRSSTYMQSKWLKVNAPNTNIGCTKENREAKDGCFNNIWTPPLVKPRRRDLGSALSTQFSNMGINCW